MKRRINIIKKIDALFGPFLLKTLPTAKPVKKPDCIKNILIIRPGGMGDASLLLPIIKELKKSLNNTTLDILCETRNSGIFYSVQYIDTIFHYDNPYDFIKLFKKKYDIIIDTEQSYFLSAVLCRFLRGVIKIGFNTNGRGKLFNKSIQYTQNKYEAEIFWDLFCEVFPINKKFTLDFPYFKNPFSGFAYVKDFVNKTGEIVCIFPGASKEECMWPEKQWAEVIDAISDSGNLPVLLGGTIELSTAAKIKKKCRTNRVIDYTGKLSLIETSRLFNISALLITTDSGILHLGVMSDIATISLFGSGNSLKWGPKGNKHIIINKNIYCSPCALFGTIPPCSNKILCMEKITSNNVITICMNVLKKTD